MTREPLPRRQIARDLTRVANAPVHKVLDTIGDFEGSLSHRIGVTGPPGGGKSTLINALVAERLGGRIDRTMAVLAIDPSSPISGGAILGDRIRMDAVADLPGLFIRSLSSRGARNGLCDNIIDLLVLLESRRFDEVILETVGVGQSEIAVHEVVDTMVVIVPPDAGDSVQTMKAGILEVADIIVVTKADQPGAQRMAADLATVIRAREGWTPPVLQTQGNGNGVDRLSAAIDAHHDWLVANRPETLSWQKRRQYHLRALFDRQVQDTLSEDATVAQGMLRDAYGQVLARLCERHSRPPM